jgi:hypothetical protein
MLMVDSEGTPLSVDIASANQAEVNLIEPLIEERALEQKPARLMYDRAADSAPLRERLGSAANRTRLPPSQKPYETANAGRTRDPPTEMALSR